MQTRFTEQQRQSPLVRQAESILRKCVHCGFCTATCPTFVLLGDEADSPRGRIYMIKAMLEDNRPASDAVVRHVDRCLTCLSCMTTCPSGVDYGHLVDQARIHIDKTYRRPLPERLLRWFLRLTMPHTTRFRVAMTLAQAGKPLARFLPGRLKGMMAGVPDYLPEAGPASRPGVFPPVGARRMRVAMLTGCVQPALRPEINEATMRLLTRLGAEVVVAKGQGCCGALAHHMGKAAEARAFARANLAAWMAELDGGDGLDAVVVNASGCGSTVKDYAHLLADDAQWAEPARRLAALTRDVSEVIADLGLPAEAGKGLPPLVVGYHAACSLQHGQKIKDLPKRLLTQAGFTVREPVDSHLCCGSAGTYSLLQPELSTQLQQRKVATLEALEPGVIAAGNIGCLMHIGGGTLIPMVHAVELLDWATGGPKPGGV